MKKLRFIVLLAHIGIGLLVGCDNGKNSYIADNNPVFQKDPVLKAISEEINKSPKNAKLFIERAEVLRKMKQDTLALKDYKHAVTLDSGNAAYYSMIGDFMFENKDLDGSVEWLEKALKKDPNDKKARLKIAKLFLYAGKYPQALSQINIVLRVDVYNPEAYFLKGMICKEQKDTAKAISSFLTAIQVSPEYKDAIIQLGILYSCKKDSIALKYLDNAFKIDSLDVFPIFARGVFYQQNNDFVHAKEEYRKCIVKNRHYVDAYFNMGSIFMLEDSVLKAMRQFDMVTKIDPRNPTAYFDRGVCKENLDSIKEAIADYRRALILDPNYKSPKDALVRLKVKSE